MSKEPQPDRVVYSEDFKVSMGDYEMKGAFISYSTDVRKDESPEDAISRARKVVKPLIGTREKQFRKKYLEFVDFDSMSKL